MPDSFNDQAQKEVAGIAVAVTLARLEVQRFLGEDAKHLVQGHAFFGQAAESLQRRIVGNA